MPDCASQSSVGRLLQTMYSWLSSLLPGPDGDRLDELRLRLLPVLLEEALTVDAVGHADHRQRPVGQMRQDVRRDLREVAQQIALGQRRLLQRRIRGPVDAIEMRERDALVADDERDRRFRRFELRDDVGDRVVGFARFRARRRFRLRARLRRRRDAPSSGRCRREDAGTPARAASRLRSTAGIRARPRALARPTSPAH